MFVPINDMRQVSLNLRVVAYQRRLRCLPSQLVTRGLLSRLLAMTLSASHGFVVIGTCPVSSPKKNGQSLSWSQLRSHVVHPLLQSHYLGTASCFLKNMGPFLGPQFDCSFGNFCLFILIREVGGVIFRDQKWAHQLVPKTRLRRPFSCTPSRVGPRGRSVRAHGACLGGSPTRAATSIPTTSRRLGRLQPAARRRQHLQDLS